MQWLYKVCDWETKEIGPEEGSFEGALSVYGIRDEIGDIVERGAFSKTIAEKKGQVPLLWQHDARQPIGLLSLEDAEDALRVRGKLVLGVPQARNAYQLMRAGVVRGLSIGFETVKQETGDDGVRRLKEIKLWEGSLVTFPANPAAQVDSIKGIEVEALKSKVEELERRLALAEERRAAHMADEPRKHSNADQIHRLLRVLRGEI